MRITLRNDFEISSVLTALDQIGGVSLTIVPDEVRTYLLTEALTYQYQPREKIVGPAKVRQDLSGTDNLPSDSPFMTLRDIWQNLLTDKLSGLVEREKLFRVPLYFNELSLQRYEIGSQGITPHLDSKGSINLICIFTLTGLCRFCVCRDRQGSNPIELDASPGTVILLRAPGFLHSDARPFHFLTDIQGPRISLGLRQEAKF